MASTGPGYLTKPGEPLAPFGAPLAGWWQRFGSMLLDCLILAIPLIVLNIILTRNFGTWHVAIINNQFQSVKSLEGRASLARWIADLAILGIYFSLLNGRGSGQTPGNHAPRIALRDVDTGRTIGMGRGVLRWLIRTILYSALIVPGLINDLFPLWDGRRQSIADKAARSVVIRLN
jgi:uncharacterized RDD family membrane protein YckC